MKWTFLLAFGGIGLTCLIVGIVWGSRRYTLWQEGIRVTGTVVDVYESHSTRTDNGRTTETTSIYPIAEFTARDGKTYRFKGSTGMSSPDFVIGDKREVIYSPLNPAVAQFSSFTQFWLGPLGIGLFGLVFLLVGVGSQFTGGNRGHDSGFKFREKTDNAGPAGNDSRARAAVSVTSGYGEKARCSSGTKIIFPDFTLEYAGINRVQGPNNAKWHMTVHLFNISDGKDSRQISWSSGAGDIAPAAFEFGGKKYNIEMAYSEGAGDLENDELVVNLK
jgi:hypothetical protein